jgi:inner membrane protein involved in colicin E2 resistance
MSRALIGVILFTALEVVTLVAWLILAGLPFNLSVGSVLAVVVLSAGLFVEHYVSVNVGNGRPPFGPLP